MPEADVRYVIGFAFDRFKPLVALIRKDHPDWQAGKLNGVGGKIEPGESPAMAMAREFEEEAGLWVPPRSWKRVATMRGEDTDGLSWDVAVFRVWLDHDLFLATYSPTSEPVEYHDLPLGLDLDVIHNLRFLVPLARDYDAPRAEFDYTDVDHAKEAATQDREHHGGDDG